MKAMLAVGLLFVAMNSSALSEAVSPDETYDFASTFLRSLGEIQMGEWELEKSTAAGTTNMDLLINRKMAIRDFQVADRQISRFLGSKNVFIGKCAETTHMIYDGGLIKNLQAMTASSERAMGSPESVSQKDIEKDADVIVNFKNSKIAIASLSDFAIAAMELIPQNKTDHITHLNLTKEQHANLLKQIKDDPRWKEGLQGPKTGQYYAVASVSLIYKFLSDKRWLDRD